MYSLSAEAPCRWGGIAAEVGGRAGRVLSRCARFEYRTDRRSQHRSRTRAAGWASGRRPGCRLPSSWTACAPRVPLTEGVSRSRPRSLFSSWRMPSDTPSGMARSAWIPLPTAARCAPYGSS